MSSTNDELPPPPKPRVSPLDFRNTDLVSRLLAATPPYLYNMPLVPNSYFFSEMLRSFVQTKSDPTGRGQLTNMHHRRARKRSWTQVRSEYCQKASPKPEKRETPPLNWTPKPLPQERLNIFDNKHLEGPLELTTGKLLNNNIKTNEIDIQNDSKLQLNKNDEDYVMDTNRSDTSNPNVDSSMPITFPSVHNQEANSNLILPPPPPIWYPPLYPSPYGIDPLHFFIDLRVSGHIYDRKNRDCLNNPTTQTSTAVSPIITPTRDSNPQEQLQPNSHCLDQIRDSFRQSKHASAFSVPTSTLHKNIPINLSNMKNNETKTENKECTKFDVKSMGFDKNSNKTSTNYVMNNIGRIYNDVRGSFLKNEELGKQVVEEANETCNKETEEEKQKKVKDLRALIGLELVVDYMNHTKPRKAHQNSEESSTDLESSGSPAVEVVALHETDLNM